VRWGGFFFCRVVVGVVLCCGSFGGWGLGVGFKVFCVFGGGGWGFLVGGCGGWETTNTAGRGAPELYSRKKGRQKLGGSREIRPRSPRGDTREKTGVAESGTSRHCRGELNGIAG